MRVRFGAAGAWGHCAPAAPVRRVVRPSTSPLDGTTNSTLTVSRALLVALTGCIALWGCTTITVHDLAIAGVSVTNSDEWFDPRENWSGQSQPVGAS